MGDRVVADVDGVTVELLRKSAAGEKQDVELAAAAPYLLAALNALLERFDPYAVPGTDKNLEAERMAREAVERACGGA